jgi:hypothetical protein
VLAIYRGKDGAPGRGAHAKAGCGGDHGCPGLTREQLALAAGLRLA